MTTRLAPPETSRAPTGLGYGCSQLMGGITRRESVALLLAAFDAGVRHFDTAPSYGYGQAEGVLGEALASRRSQITIATKYGLRPPRRQNLLGLARRVAMPVVRRLPAVRSRLSRAAGSLVERGHFSPAELRASIEASLQALRTDYIDVLLLHEAVVDDLGDALFEELERNVRSGKIRSFGVGSDVAAAAQIYRVAPRFCPVIQFQWSVLSGGKPACPGVLLITHRSLSHNLPRLHDWLRAHAAVARAWSSELGLDVTDAANLSRLMLSAARDANPEGVILFSSRKADNIRRNARLLLDGVDPRAGAALAALVARDAAALVTVPAGP